MSLPYYDPQYRIYISEVPQFPAEDELRQKNWEIKDVLKIQEWRTYYIKIFDPDSATAFDKAPRFAKRLAEFYEVNFKNYTGLTRISGINLRVENRKISDNLYESMLAYVSDKYAALVFSFDTPTGLEHDKSSPGDESDYVRFLFLKKRLLDSRPNIDDIASLILSEPHRKLFTEKMTCKIDEADATDAALLMNMFAGSMHYAALRQEHQLSATTLAGILYKVSGQRLYPAEARKVRKYYSFDTNENRFVLHFLKDTNRFLNDFSQKSAIQPGTFLNPDIAEASLKLSQKINYLLADPLWDDVGRMTFFPEHSTVLQKRDGYRHLYNLFSLSQLATRYRFFAKDFQNIIENKDVATLFEYWCFFLVKDILDGTYKPVSYSTPVATGDDEHKLIQGVCIRYNRGFSLNYNYSASGSCGIKPYEKMSVNYTPGDSSSHSLRPDIVIIKDNGQKLVFDAKHKGRGNADGFYGDEFEGTIDTCKEEDLDKMHTYHDAIKNVQGAFALYPGKETVVYPCHGAQNKFHGIGALPLRPIEGGRPDPEHYEFLSQVIEDFIEH